MAEAPIFAQRLFDHDTGFRRHQIVAAEALANRAEEIGPDGQIEDADAVLVGLQDLFEILPAGFLARFGGDIIQAVEKPLAHVGLALVFGHMGFDGGQGEGAKRFTGHGAARRADDAGARRNLALHIAVEKGRQQFALGQVAGGAKDDEIEDVDRNGSRGHILLQIPVLRYANQKGDLHAEAYFCNNSIPLIY